MSDPREAPKVAPLPDVRRRMNEGARLLERGQSSAAAELFEQAAQLQPDYPDAPAMRGVTAFVTGDHALAERLLRHALTLAPNRPDLLQNLGLVLGAQGRLEEELRTYAAALKAEPRNPALYELLGQAELRAGKPELAVATYSDLLKLQPDHAIARHNLTLALMEAPFKEWTREREALLLHLLTHQDIELLHLAPAVGAVVRHRHGIATGAEEPALQALANDPLLIAALATLYFADSVTERFLTRTRSRVLAALDATAAPTPDLLRLAAALGIHSFSNDYAFLVGDGSGADAEGARVAALGEALAAALEDQPLGAPGEVGAALAAAVARHALFAPLHAHPGAAALAALPPTAWPPELRPLLLRTLVEVREELARGERIAAFGPVAAGDATSASVKAMYEEHPYPRWQSFGFVAAQPVGLLLGQALPGWTPPAWSDGRMFDVLIAGCGTGRHALRAALHYQGARVLAVDLSRRSLAYAQRMAERFGARNIEFVQGDLLELPTLGRRFQLIETIGSFETLADPAAGWAALRACLADDGLLHVGSYSETARGPVVRARARIAALGIPATADGMRRFRRMVLDGELDASGRGDGRRLAAVGDFYSLAGVRDFLFHVQEHRFMLRQLRDLAAANGLRFVGFHPLRREVRAGFLDHVADPGALANLDRWAAWEDGKPEIVGELMNLAMWFGWYEPAQRAGKAGG
jgi:SAM-dependent methyltransferase/lipoprotein NlpI